MQTVFPKVELNKKQKKTLDESIPAKVREILEKAENFEILAEVENENDSLPFEPNRIAKIFDDEKKKRF